MLFCYNNSIEYNQNCIWINTTFYYFWFEAFESNKSLHEIFAGHQIFNHMLFVVWLSNWVRTLFFNSTQLDEQNPKSSPRIRTSELAQNSDSDRIACSVQFVERNLMINSRIDLSIRAFCINRNSDWTLDEQVCLFDSIRRTKVRGRVIRSNKNPNPFDSLGREGYVQPCPNLELNARARVQLNSTITLVIRT